MTATNECRKRFAVTVLGTALAFMTLAAAMPNAANADTHQPSSHTQQTNHDRVVQANQHDAQSRERDRQNFLRSRQRQALSNLHTQQTLAHDQQISRENDARNREHDEQSRERDKQNFLRSQQKHHAH